MPLVQATIKRLPLALLLACSTALAAPMPAAKFQQILVTQVDKESSDRYAVLPLDPDESSRQLSQAVLARLWASKAYQDNMQEWLAANSAPTQEELVNRWFRHYHGVFGPAFEFLGEDTVTTLYRIKAANAISAMNRGDCQDKPLSEVRAAVTEARNVLIKQHQEKLATDIAAAYVRELARLKSPRPGDRPIGQVMTAMTMEAFSELKKSLPPADQPIFESAFSYKQAAVSARDSCDKDWVTSNAIVNATTANASVLRRSVTKAAYGQGFDNVVRPNGAMRPTDGGFKPGKAFLHYPVLLVRQRVTGSTTVVLDIDAAGKVTKVSVPASTLSPAAVTSADGRVFASADVLLPVYDKYYRDGTFPPKVVDGVAVPYSTTVPVHWQ